MTADRRTIAITMHEWSPLITEATRALTTHRLRTTLSIIGVVGAVATIVTCAAIIEGGRREALAFVGALGERNVVVRAASAPLSTAIGATVDINDVRALAARLPGVVAIAAARTSHLDLVANGTRMQGTVVGVTANWREVSRVHVARGRWFTREDVERRTRAAVIGAAAAERLAAGSSGIGQQVKAGDEWFTIVGVLERQARAAGATQRFDLDEATLVPFLAASRRAGADDAPERAHEVVIAFASADFVARAASRLAALTQPTHAHPSRPATEILIPREILRARLATRRSFDLTLLGVGIVSLVISGVAIMNIMLASVAERTQEIGTRRACGARRADILLQFTLEAVMLTLAGALGGTIAGLAVAAALALLGWSIAFSLTALILAWALVAITGLACGLYPAHRAAALTPGAALRVA